MRAPSKRLLNCSHTQGEAAPSPNKRRPPLFWLANCAACNAPPRGAGPSCELSSSACIGLWFYVPVFSRKTASTAKRFLENLGVTNAVCLTWKPRSFLYHLLHHPSYSLLVVQAFCWFQLHICSNVRIVELIVWSIFIFIKAFYEAQRMPRNLGFLGTTSLKNCSILL